MKKKLSALILAAGILTLTACGGDSLIATGNEKLADAVYNDKLISLAAYTGLKAEKKTYDVSQKAVDEAIHEKLAEYADYKSVSRASKDGDWVSTDFTASIDGEAIVAEDSYDIILGDAEYGSELDEKLTGVSAGDKLAFSLDYDADFSDTDFAGHTVDFEIKVLDIQQEILPDTTDAFVKKNLGYSTYDEFAAAERESVVASYEAESTSELQETLLSQVIDASSILQYSEKEYADAYKGIESFYISYADMFGTDLDSLYETLGVTEDDLKEEAFNALYRTMVVDAIAKNEGIALSDEDYEDGVAHYMEESEYDSKKEFLNDYGEDEIRRQLLEDQVLNFLVNNADITEIPAEHEDE